MGVLWGRHRSTRYNLFLLKLYFPNPSLSRKVLQVPTLVAPSVWNLAWTALSDRLTHNPLGPIYSSLFVCAAFAASIVWSIGPWTPQGQSRACVLCFKGQIHLSASLFHEDILSGFFSVLFSCFWIKIAFFTPVWLCPPSDHLTCLDPNPRGFAWTPLTLDLITQAS